MERIDCRKCRHFKITWENARPYACAFFGFKDVHIPSATVFASSGFACREFAPKSANGGRKEEKQERGFRT
ncbi:MAG: uracil-DNA glycosylase [Helicobacteraceae bacterium]|nr:uracil-DNA glycosylase [Helicobacteraceae bacterium]